MKKMFMLFFAVLMLLTLPSINQAQTNEEEYEFVQMVKNPDPPPEWILVPRVLSVSEQGTDWAKSLQVQPSEKEIDYAEFWADMPTEEKRSFLIGIQTGIFVPLLMLGHLAELSEEDGQKALASKVSDARGILLLAIFSSGQAMIPLKELKLRMDLFYSDESNRYEKFEQAIYDAIVRAALE